MRGTCLNCKGLLIEREKRSDDKVRCDRCLQTFTKKELRANHTLYVVDAFEILRTPTSTIPTIVRVNNVGKLCANNAPVKIEDDAIPTWIKEEHYYNESPKIIFYPDNPNMTTFNLYDPVFDIHREMDGVIPVPIHTYYIFAFSVRPTKVRAGYSSLLNTWAMGAEPVYRFLPK